MKLFFVIIILIFFQSCSFDDKTGIWKNDNKVSNKKDPLFKDFKTFSSVENIFNEKIEIDSKFNFVLSNSINNSSWQDIFFNQTNNFQNFKYSNKNQLIFKSKKITKYETDGYLLFENNNAIISDHKGNLIVFSVSQNKIVQKYNFYKKKFKKISKKLNLVVEENIIYVSDNLGYLYAYNIQNNQIIWAKNYKIPFRSNLKISEDKLIAANQNNDLFFFSKKSGEILKLIPTEETVIKNRYINNISSNGKISFFLNTYGSLYGINNKNMKIQWFLNLNKSLDLNPSNLFKSNQIIAYDDMVIVSTDKNLFILNSTNGKLVYKNNFISLIKPLIIDNYLFLINKNNLLISLNLTNLKIIYSYDVNELISEFLNTKKKNVQFKSLMMANNKVLIFLENSYLLQFNIYGKLEFIKKLPIKLKTEPLFIDQKILFLSSKNNIAMVN